MSNWKLRARQAERISAELAKRLAQAEEEHAFLVASTDAALATTHAVTGKAVAEAVVTANAATKEAVEALFIEKL